MGQVASATNTLIRADIEAAGSNCLIERLRLMVIVGGRGIDDDP